MTEQLALPLLSKTAFAGKLSNCEKQPMRCV
jgi:hypothetical protein